MLRHGLPEMRGSSLTLPERKQDRPYRSRLEQRFAEFLRRVSQLAGIGAVQHSSSNPRLILVRSASMGRALA